MKNIKNKVRFCITIDKNLLDQLDLIVKLQPYKTSRSDVIRKLLQNCVDNKNKYET